MYLVVPPGLKCKHIAFRLVTVGAQNLLRFFPDALSRKKHNYRYISRQAERQEGRETGIQRDRKAGA